MSLLFLLIVVAILVTLAFASLRWGANSRDTVDSREWWRRQNYPQHHL
jgi:hypothetical protein